MSTYAIAETMLSPIFAGGGKVEWIEKTVAQPGPGQLLVKAKANALCGSEKSFYHNGSGLLTPGHEASGIVVMAGSETTVKAETRGVVFLMDYCGQCRSCLLGHTNQCLHKRADMGFTHDGGYGEYLLIHENIFFAIDDDLSYSDATLLLDVIGTGGHAVRRALSAKKDIESVLIAGAGPIGLAILAMVKIMLGAHIPVAITDVVDYRLELAKTLGGIPLRADSDSLQRDMKEQGVERADIALDSSGRTAARQQCIELLNQRGVLVCVGHGGELNLTVSRHLIAPERTVMGSEYFTFNELQESAAYLRVHQDYLKQIITHRFPAQELQAAADLFFSGQCGKVVVEHE